MMKPLIVESNGAISLAQLQCIEATLGRRLPADYCDFLLSTNGGRPRPNTVPAIGFHEGTELVVHTFYGVTAENKCNDLLRAYVIWIENCPVHLLPIAYDEGGSEFCISLEGDDYGNVYYWDCYKGRHPWYGGHKRADVRYPWTFHLTSDFRSFLDGFFEGGSR